MWNKTKLFLKYVRYYLEEVSKRMDVKCIKETVMNLQKYLRSWKTVREINRVKMKGLNRGKQPHNKTVPDNYKTKDRESNDTLGNLCSNLLDTEKCICDISRDTKTELFSHFETNLCDKNLVIIPKWKQHSALKLIII